MAMTRTQKTTIAFLLIAFGAASRLLPHTANAVPVAAIGLFAGAYLGRGYAIGVPLAAMAFSDVFIGFDSGPVTASIYLSFALAGCIGIVVRRFLSPFAVIAGSTLSSVLFFLATNAAVWEFGSMYPHTLAGFLECFTLAIPFFRPTFFGDLGYTALLFGTYEVARFFSRRRLKFSPGAF